MKNLLFIITCLLLATTASIAQNCSNFIYLQKGKVIETTGFNAAGQVMRKLVNTITDVTTANGATTATASSESFDRSGHSLGTKNIVYKCTGDAFLMDLSASSPQGGSAKMNATYMEFPANMKVGDHFKDIQSDLTMTMGARTMNMTTKITDRMVAGKESITTPAGTWDCFKITYTATTSAQGNPMPPQTQQFTQWFAPNFGVVQFQAGAMMVKVTAVH
jgi:hypothetical protein